MSWHEWVAAESDSIRSAGQWRRSRTLDGGGPQFRLADGSAVVSFASNDYLGLSQHPKVKEAAKAGVDRWGTGAGSSRLIVGDRTVHSDLEGLLAEWRGTEACLVFPSGYHANLAVLTTFGDGATVVSDELNHASIIDAARLARATVHVYRHRDFEHANRLVREASGRTVVITDTVFSMDGDVAPVAELAELCAAYGALLVLDDAHAVLDVPDVDAAVACLRVGTLSKALGSQGGYVAGSRAMVDLLVNRARSFIFTTGLAPPSAAAAAAAVEIVRGSEGDRLRESLRSHVDMVRAGHPTPIVPVVIGDEADALAASEKLLAEGLLVPAVRPPTVPPGTSRLRVSLSAAHSVFEVERLSRALASLG
jgi:8-amino-7-oxononanoate synthase